MMRLFKKYISVNKPAAITYDEAFYQILRETARHPIVLRMKLYPHHGTTNCYIHCLHVAYFNYKWCKALGLDYESAARAGMIHDLFLYDWHTHAKETGEYFHPCTAGSQKCTKAFSSQLNRNGCHPESYVACHVASYSTYKRRMDHYSD